MRASPHPPLSKVGPLTGEHSIVYSGGALGWGVLGDEGVAGSWDVVGAEGGGDGSPAVLRMTPPAILVAAEAMSSNPPVASPQVRLTVPRPDMFVEKEPWRGLEAMALAMAVISGGRAPPSRGAMAATRLLSWDTSIRTADTMTRKMMPLMMYLVPSLLACRRRLVLCWP